MPCNLKNIPKEIEIKLNYPYLSADEQPIHFFPRITQAQAREMREEVFGSGDTAKDDIVTFRWWSRCVLDKTAAQYEGLGKDWKQSLWDDDEGRWHIIHAIQGYFATITPRSFLAI